MRGPSNATSADMVKMSLNHRQMTEVTFRISWNPHRVRISQVLRVVFPLMYHQNCKKVKFLITFKSKGAENVCSSCS